MLKFLTLVAPYILKGRKSGPATKVAGRSLVYMLIGLATIFLLSALFVLTLQEVSLEAAFAIVGVALLFLALTVHLLMSLKTKTNSKGRALSNSRGNNEKYLAGPELPKGNLPETMQNDLLANYIPDGLKDDPVIGKLLKEIGENPITSTAVAVTLGMLISRDLFKD